MPLGKRVTPVTSNAHAAQAKRAGGAKVIGILTKQTTYPGEKRTMWTGRLKVLGCARRTEDGYTDGDVVSASNGTFENGTLNITVDKSYGDEPTTMKIVPGTNIQLRKKYFKGSTVPTVPENSMIEVTVCPEMQRHWCDGVDKNTGEPFEKGGIIMMRNGLPNIKWIASDPVQLKLQPPTALFAEQLKTALNPKMVEYHSELRYDSDGKVIPYKMSLSADMGLVVRHNEAGEIDQISWTTESSFNGPPVEYTDEKNYLKMAVNIARVILTLKEDGEWHKHLVVFTSNNMANYMYFMNEELYEKFGVFLWQNFEGMASVVYPSDDKTNRAETVQTEYANLKPVAPGFPEEFESPFETIVDEENTERLDIEWDEVSGVLSKTYVNYDFPTMAVNMGARISPATLNKVKSQFKKFGAPVAEAPFPPNMREAVVLNDLDRSEWFMVPDDLFYVYAIDPNGEVTTEEEFLDHIDGQTDIDDILLVAVRKEYDSKGPETGSKRGRNETEEDEAGESSRRSKRR